MNTAKIYHDSNGEERTIWQMIKLEPEWAANRIQESEKFIEKFCKLKEQNKQLREYAQHKPDCCTLLKNYEAGFSRHCDCGKDKLIKE